MFVLKVSKKKAEKTKIELLDKGIYNKNYKPEKDKTFIYFPTHNKALKGTYVSKKLEKIEKHQNYKELLISKIPKAIFDKLPSSFDIIGNILILELKEDLQKYEKEIAKAILDTHKNIKTILKKKGIHKGEFRTQKLGYIGGRKTKETTHKENKTQLKLDVEKVYFSPRTGTERKRIFKQIKKNESILVMFSGCGPYPITISKNTQAKEIVGIEKNKIAHKYAQENLLLNKTKNIKLINGDVEKIIPKTTKKFDRIIMPLPKNADTFLDLAFSVSKKGTKIHIYDFEHESEINNIKKKIQREAKKSKVKYKINKIVKCGQYSPGKYKICVDFQLI